jgi:hypothetical protein
MRASKLTAFPWKKRGAGPEIYCPVGIRVHERIGQVIDVASTQDAIDGRLIRQQQSF